MRNFWLRLAVFGFAFSLCSNAYSTPVTFQYSGTITTRTDNNNLFAGAFQVGDAFSGTVTYDPAQFLSPFTSNIYDFLNGQITLTSNGHTVIGGTDPAAASCWPSAVNCREPFDIAVSNNGAAEGDRLAYSSLFLTYDGATLPGSPPNALLQLRLQDTITKTALTSTSLPIEAPTLSAFNVHTLNFFGSDANRMTELYSFSGEVTNITPVAATSVPEPNSLVLLGFGIAALVVYRHRSRRAQI